MFLSLAILVPYAIAFLCFIAQISEAKYPVAILDNEQKFSPRLYGVSTIVYNNEMYAYGGQTALAFLVSNKMYKFSFDIEKKNVSMETVDQATPGPNCTSCGSVLINKTQMLVLTHEHASRNDTETAQQVVKPYTFDFVTKAWSEPVPANLPRYNELQKHVFVMRRRHKTILGKDGCVYVIGGTNFFNSTYMQESWYYDPSKNEYGVLSDNRNRTTRMHSSLVNLPNGKIGVLFGYDESGSYYSPSQMSIINTNTKSWEDNTISLDGTPPYPSLEVTVQTDSDSNYAYFFGGRFNSVRGKFLNNTLEILDLKNNRWLKTDNQHETGAIIKQRYFSSSAIIDGNFITAFGTEDENTAGEMSDLDVVPIPDELKAASSADPPLSVTVQWKASLDQENLFTLSSEFMEGSTFYIIITTSIALVIFIVFLGFTKVSAQRIAGGKKYTLLPSLSLNHKAGELASTEVYRIFVQIICITVFSGVLGYLLYNVSHSSLSETEELQDVEYQTLPDIRFCYSGYEEYNSNITIPKTVCSYEMIQTESTNCTDSHIVDLSKLLHMPSFPQERLSTKCYMYKYSTDDSMRLYRYNPTARFSHVGGAYRPTEVIFVQFYEPTKNPNRVLFFNESLEGLGIKEMDQWKESERRAGTSIDVMRQILLAYPESDISVQYEVVHRKSIDAKNVWNYFGPFPRYIESTELSITHNDALDRGRNHLVTDPNTVLGTIHVTPNNFKKRIITEKRDTTLLSVFGNIGGVASIIFAVYAFLFGTKPVGPWGIVQKTSWVKHQKQKKLKQLEDSFNISKVQGVPLVTPVHQRYAEIYSKNAPSDEKIQQVNEELSIMELGVREAGDDSSSRDVSDLKYRMEQMEGRNQMLELILKAYYVDDEIFQQLNKARAEGGDTYANRLSSQSTCNFESHLLKQSYH